LYGSDKTFGTTGTTASTVTSGMGLTNYPTDPDAETGSQAFIRYGLTGYAPK